MLVEDPTRISGCQSNRKCWHELKEFMRREVKPRNKSELVDGTLRSWPNMDKAKCQKYIRHL